MLRVGLTGGIGAGKSTVSARLAEHGAFLLDADRVAREVVEPGTPGLAAVVAEFGRGVLAADGSLDRAELARVVFGDEPARLRLNAILHPRIAARTAGITAEITAGAPAGAILVHDVPLLVENGMGPAYHLVIVVDAPEQVRVSRLVARGLTAHDARQRVGSQTGEQARREAADVWLDNSGPVDALLSAADRLWSERLAPYAANLLAGRPAARPQRVTLVPPRSEWAAAAARVIARIRRAGTHDRAVRIDHIGSTAVSGLPGKDVIDVQVVLPDLGVAAALAAELPAAAGLVRRPGRWWDETAAGEIDKIMLTDADPGQAVNCHLRQHGSPAWREALLLRDWLRRHPDDVREYAAVKARLAATHAADVEAYARAKSPFIRSVLARAAGRPTPD